MSSHFFDFHSIPKVNRLTALTSVYGYELVRGCQENYEVMRF